MRVVIASADDAFCKNARRRVRAGVRRKTADEALNKKEVVQVASHSILLVKSHFLPNRAQMIGRVRDGGNSAAESLGAGRSV